MPLSIVIDGTDYFVDRYSYRHILGRPSKARVTFRHDVGSPRDFVAEWVGKQATINWTGADADWSETLDIASVRSRRTHARLICVGPSWRLTQRRSRRAWSNTAPVEAVEDLLNAAGLDPDVTIRNGADKVPILLQLDQTDHAFISGLARSFGFVLIDRPDGSILICDRPEGGEAFFEESDVVPEETLAKGAVAPTAVETTTLIDGEAIARVVDGEGNSLIKGPVFEQSPHMDEEGYISKVLANRRKSLEPIVTTRVAIRRGDVFLGQTVAGHGGHLPTGGIVKVSRKLRSGIVVSRVSVTNEDEFVRIPKGAFETAGPSMLLASIAEAKTQPPPGWIVARLPWQQAHESVLVQWTTPGGGGGSGPFWLPQVGAQVLLALEGDPSIPRLVFLGVLSHSKHPPKMEQSAAKPDAMLVSSGGATVHFTEREGSESVLIGYGEHNVTMRIDKDGAIAINGTKVTIVSERFSVEADQINLSGNAIEAKRK
ncbi:contractile injection system protein, VgrG/Pvc8 family [Rhizobium sp. N4311]|uniref:phage baseplate assembly protein V n=1 Tax=Rhizobium sp. N4311 TaxID=1703972 RepID=UPI000B967BCD|nr:contractile injection system protein, VgrG/Pvc8 family [Rhizobium sp. N4311]OYD02811.1 phage late control GPD protein [Rhizobium sp. N4311]